MDRLNVSILGVGPAGIERMGNLSNRNILIAAKVIGLDPANTKSIPAPSGSSADPIVILP